MILRIAATVLLAVACSASAAAAELPPELFAVLESAAADGLPVAMLEQKAQEGLAKGVPAERVAAVVEQLARDMQHARDLTGHTDAAVLDAVVAARRAGASDAAIRDIATRAAVSHDAVALRSLADLLAAGLSEKNALRLVRSALDSDQPQVGLLGLATATATMLATGMPESSVVTRVADTVATGASPLSAVPAAAGGPPPHAGGNGNGNGNANGHGNGNGNGGHDRDRRAGGRS